MSKLHVKITSQRTILREKYVYITRKTHNHIFKLSNKKLIKKIHQKMVSYLFK